MGTNQSTVPVNGGTRMEFYFRKQTCEARFSRVRHSLSFGLLWAWRLPAFDVVDAWAREELLACPSSYVGSFGFGCALAKIKGLYWEPQIRNPKNIVGI